LAGPASSSRALRAALLLAAVVPAVAPAASSETVVKVGKSPNYLDVGGNVAWVGNTNGKSVSAIDVAKNAVKATTALSGYPYGVEYGDGSVWVVDGNCVVGQSGCTPASGHLRRISPSSAKVTATIGVGKTPFAVLYAFSSIWVANYASGTLSRVSPGSNKVVATISVGAQPYGLAVANGDLWVLSLSQHAVRRLDPGTNKVVGTTTLPKSSTNGIASGLGAVWVSTPSSLMKVDPSNVKVLGTYTGLSGGRDVIAASSAVWVTDASTDELVQIDPNTLEKVGGTAVQGNPVGVAYGNGSLWVANRSSGSVSRITP
jgi:YVTN family beta-propeller protein